ncbi:MAG: hypothetical protein ABSG49_08765 [Methanoregula sp.]|jgi:ABC-type molybdate transport system substrate-binding protein|uniref:hypothetical protein n=1 Tax=Methanoregula sp. TaxID=2052170 RepID=UPI003C1B6D35
MRSVHWTCLFVIILVIICGCLQPAPSNTSPATPAAPITPPVTATSNPNAQKQVNFTVTQAGSMLNITYDGGPDAADLASIAIRITNHDGTQITRTIDNPVVDYTYVFPYRGVANAAFVNIIGTFGNGYQQTVLMYYM